MSVEACRELVDHDHPLITLSRQIELLGMSHSGFYYQPRIDPYDDQLMRLIDEVYTEFPYYGSRRIHAQLARDGHAACRERVQRLMRLWVLRRSIRSAALLCRIEIIP